MTPEELRLEDARRRTPLDAITKPPVKEGVVQVSTEMPGGVVVRQKDFSNVPRSTEPAGTIPVEDAIVVDRARQRAQAFVNNPPLPPIINPVNNLGVNSRALTMKWMASGSPGGDLLGPSDAQGFFDKVSNAAMGKEESFTNAEWEAFGPQLEKTVLGSVVMKQRKESKQRVANSIQEAVAKNPDLSVEDYQKIVKQAGGKYSSDLALLWGAKLMPDSIKAKIASDATDKELNKINDSYWQVHAKRNGIDPSNQELREQYMGDPGTFKIMRVGDKVVPYEPSEEQARISREWWESSRSTGNTKDWTGEQLVKTAKATPSVQLMADGKITDESFKSSDAYSKQYDYIPESETGVTRMPSDTINLATKSAVSRIDKGLSPSDAVDAEVFSLVDGGTITSVGRAGLLRFRKQLVESVKTKLGEEVKKSKGVADQQYQVAEDRVNQMADELTKGIYFENNGQPESRMPKEMKFDMAADLIGKKVDVNDPIRASLVAMRDSIFGSATGSSPLEVEVFDRFEQAILKKNFGEARRESKSLYNMYFVYRNAIEEGSSMIRLAQEEQAKKDFEEQKKIKDASVAAFTEAKQKFYGLSSLPGVTEENWPQFVDQKSGLLYKDPYSHQADIATSDWFAGMDDSTGTLGKFKNSMFSTESNTKYLSNRARYDLTAAAKSGRLDAGVLAQYGMTLQAVSQADKVIKAAYKSRKEITNDNAAILSKQNEAEVAKAIPSEFAEDVMKPGSVLANMFIKGASDPTNGLEWMAQAALLIAANEKAASSAIVQVGNVSSLNERIRTSVLDGEDRASAMPLLEAMQKFRNGELSEDQQIALKDEIENAAIGIQDYDERLTHIADTYGVMRAKDYPVMNRVTDLPMVEGGMTLVPATQSVTAKQILDFADEIGVASIEKYPREFSEKFYPIDSTSDLSRMSSSPAFFAKMAKEKGKPVYVDKSFHPFSIGATQIFYEDGRIAILDEKRGQFRIMKFGAEGYDPWDVNKEDNPIRAAVNIGNPELPKAIGSISEKVGSLFSGSPDIESAKLAMRL